MAKRKSDPKEPSSSVRITDFGGMSPGTDQHDNNPGLSWFQVNCVPFHPGELRCRQGFQVVRFEGQPEDFQEDLPIPTERFSEATTKLFLGVTAEAPTSVQVEAFTHLLLEPRADGGSGLFHVSAATGILFGSLADSHIPGHIDVSATSTLSLHAQPSARIPGDINVSSATGLTLGAQADGHAPAIFNVSAINPMFLASQAATSVPGHIDASAATTMTFNTSSSARIPLQLDVSASSRIVASASSFGSTGAISFGLMGMI